MAQGLRQDRYGGDGPEKALVGVVRLVRSQDPSIRGRVRRGRDTGRI